MTDALVEIFRQTRVVLLDFDGPVCSVFAGLPAARVADGLKRLLRDQRAHLPLDVVELADPLKVLRRTADIAPELVDKVEAAFMAYEIEAADSRTCVPLLSSVLERSSWSAA